MSTCSVVWFLYSLARGCELQYARWGSVFVEVMRSGADAKNKLRGTQYVRLKIPILSNDPELMIPNLQFLFFVENNTEVTELWEFWKSEHAGTTRGSNVTWSKGGFSRSSPNFNRRSFSNACDRGVNFRHQPQFDSSHEHTTNLTLPESLAAERPPLTSTTRLPNFCTR